MSRSANPAAEAERVFVIAFADAHDAVARLLTLFAIQGCGLQALVLDRAPEAVRLRVHALGLDDDRADHLRRRLEALPLVKGVSLGWRTRAEAPIELPAA